MTKHEKFLSKLTKLAIEVPKTHKVKMVSAIVYRNNTLAVCTNKSKTDPFAVRFQGNSHKLYLHAETSAIKTALSLLSLEQLADCTLYICRVKQTPSLKWVWGMAKPCQGCQRAIATFNIRKVYFTTNNGYSWLS